MVARQVASHVRLGLRHTVEFVTPNNAGMRYASSAGEAQLKIAIAGGGICGALLASQLSRVPGVELAVYERCARGALPPGLNLLVSHNGMSALADLDSELAAKLRSRGCSTPGWKARTMTGEVLYDIPDAQAVGLTDGPGIMARWNDVAATMIEAVGESNIHWATSVRNVEYITSEKKSSLSVTVHQHETDNIQTESDVDLLIACDGRFSSVRHLMNGIEDPQPSFGPPSIVDFRLVVHDTKPGLIEGLERVYNVPNAEILMKECYSHLSKDADMTVSMGGLVRVGIGRIQPCEKSDAGLVGIFGNIRMPGGGAAIPEAIKTADGLRALFTPAEGEKALDDLGWFILEAVCSNADQIHWNRKQEVSPCYKDKAGRILFIGDSAGGFYPSLAQGATTAIEDACAAAAVLKEFVSFHKGRAKDIPAVTELIQDLRQPRRSQVAAMSRMHAEHVGLGGRAALEAEAADWLGTEGGSLPLGEWREHLREVWRGWPRQNEHSMKARRLAALSLTASVQSTGLLPVATATPENFLPFGQLCRPTEDGVDFSDADAQLDGFANGIPRFYLMNLRGPRPLRFNRITHHKLVTQCLGLASNDADFYLAVHAPTPPGTPPSLAGLRAFRVPPSTFVLLYKGTWHAGPLWGEAPEKLFYNLELHDTNITDHTSEILQHPGSPDGFIHFGLE